MGFSGMLGARGCIHRRSRCVVGGGIKQWPDSGGSHGIALSRCIQRICSAAAPLTYRFQHHRPKGGCHQLPRFGRHRLLHRTHRQAGRQPGRQAGRGRALYRMGQGAHTTQQGTGASRLGHAESQPPPCSHHKPLRVALHPAPQQRVQHDDQPLLGGWAHILFQQFFCPCLCVFVHTCSS